MTNLTDYICINHHLMTVMEMEQETGAKADTIRHIMKKNGWEPLGTLDRVRDYIKAHPGLILEDIADHLGIQVNYTRTIAKEMGIELTTRFQMRGKENEPGKVTGYSLMHRAFNDTEPIPKEKANRIMKKTKRVQEAYSQGGSPYGIADEVRQLKLKK